MIYFAPNIGTEKEAFSKVMEKCGKMFRLEKYGRVFRAVNHVIRIT